jgi:2-polyprenyl-3-methyl-5-hydroxy-6-metoxy-1,4-benzoquinol methylase
VWVDPQPALDQLGRLYENYWTHVPPANGQRPENGFRTITKRFAKSAFATAFFWRSSTFRSGLNYLEDLEPGRILDVGCGNGAFLARAAAAGWKATGVDFDLEAVEAAKLNVDVEAYAGSIMDQRFPAASFDAITMDNVIEHLPNPIETVRECARLLRPGGRLVIMTPNIGSLGHVVFGQDWRGLEPPRHLQIFSASGLKNISRRAGFCSVKIFSSTGNAASGRGILEASAGIARAAGRPVPAVNERFLLLREKILDVLGIKRGEWLVLIAQANR